MELPQDIIEDIECYESQRRELERFEDVPWKWGLMNVICLCKVIKCYDGDTCTIIFKQFDRIWKTRCRLAHINTPEIRGTSGEELERALEAKEFLESQVLNKIVFVAFGDNDKYGRPLIQIYNESHMCVNQLLLDNELANEYP